MSSCLSFAVSKCSHAREIGLLGWDQNEEELAASGGLEHVRDTRMPHSLRVTGVGHDLRWPVGLTGFSSGHGIHTDVNGARTLESGRSAYNRGARHSAPAGATGPRPVTRGQPPLDGSPSPGTCDTTRARMTSAKVRGSPYYRSVAAAMEPPLIRTLPTQHVVADVSAGQSTPTRWLA